MILKNSLIYLNQFFFFIYNKLREFYLNSKIYNKKISRVKKNNLKYKPSPSLLECIVKVKKEKNNISDLSLDKIWLRKNINNKDFINLNSFFWLFTLDLNSPKKDVQSTIAEWINKNHNYNNLTWEVDILSKRIISWISNAKITYEDSDDNYKEKFDWIIKKQVNHLINEIKQSQWIDNKMIGCSAIILTGIAYNEKYFLDYGFDLLKKIIKVSFDKDGFPKTRNLRQLNFYLKYFILIREWLKESQNEISDYLDEIIYYLGQAFTLTNKNISNNFLFNGNHNFKDANLEIQIKKLGYNFKNDLDEVGGYLLLKNKNFVLAADLGPSPERNYSKDYQSGALSFEFISNKNKIITNSGYFQNPKHQLNLISKFTASQTTLSVGNSSSVNFLKSSDGKNVINNSLRIFDKNISSNKNLWSFQASHDGYAKRYGINHQRKVEFNHTNLKLSGTDNIIKRKNFKSTNFEIRFHLIPSARVMKTQDGKSIFIEVEKEGWKFTSSTHKIDFETGLYFGYKNSFIENQNIFISDMISEQGTSIKWEIERVQ